MKTIWLNKTIIHRDVELFSISVSVPKSQVNTESLTINSITRPNTGLKKNIDECSSDELSFVQVLTYFNKDELTELYWKIHKQLGDG